MRTRGTLSFDEEKSDWVIECPPDVALRLKRIFPRMNQTRSTVLRIRHTMEVAADLEWALDRFPLAQSLADKKRLRRGAREHRAKLERLEQIVTQPPLSSSFAMTMPPRDYQSVAARLFLEQKFLLLGDEIGAGKTVTAIAALTDSRTIPAVVVVKGHLAKQWRDELARFIPLARTHIIKSVGHYDLPESQVYIISYNKLYSWWGILAQKCRCVIFDEIQELRIQDSKKYEAARGLTAELTYRLGMSATPIFNYGGEIWNIFNLLCPDVLGSESEFREEWCFDGSRHISVRDPVALGSYLRENKLLLRRTRREIGRVLPPVTRYVQDVEFDRNVYNQGLASADELARLLLSGTFLERGQAAREFDLQLRQATGLAKAPYVAELVRMLVGSGERVLLGGWHRAVHDVWQDRLRDCNIGFFTGAESATAKERAKQAFLHGDSRVLSMSLRSGDGTDGLQKVCSCVVIGELDWTPQVHNQLVGRVDRDGQEAAVQVFIPIAPVGSDPTIANILGLKGAQSSGIVDLGKPNTEEFTETDPRRLKILAADYLRSRGLPVPESDQLVA